ncbi:MAG: hypothetical protein JW982_14400 [Spirochaetes bacterium]|nr:hypothetical protein [Spirochaetota bacterium]
MFCEKCNKNKATIHLTEIIKNIKSEVHLCEECAREIGLNSKLSNFSLSIPDFLSFLDIQTDDDNLFQNEKPVCLSCGTSLSEIRKSNKAGCADCYYYLKSGIDKYLLEHFYSNQHCGKTPARYISFENHEKPEDSENLIKNTEDMQLLELMLKEAVDAERYEDAALIKHKLDKFSNEVL